MIDAGIVLIVGVARRQLQKEIVIGDTIACNVLAGVEKFENLGGYRTDAITRNNVAVEVEASGGILDGFGYAG